MAIKVTAKDSKALLTISLLSGSLLLSNVSQAAIVLDFEGLQDNEQILDYYNGGYGGNGSGPGDDYGISFGSNALAIIDSDAGGTGNFGGEPSPSTAMYFLTGTSVLTMDEGFETGFSFSYSAINQPGYVVVYDGPNATGNVVETIHLPTTQSDGGDPTGDFSPFVNQGVHFDGVARSVDFGGTVNQIGFDDITFGSVTPGTEVDMPFLVGDPETDPTYLSRITNFSFDNESDEIITRNGEFDTNNPTYVITHGWQPDYDHVDQDWNFADIDGDNVPNEYEEIPLVQRAIIEAISDRLDVEADALSGSLKANILMFEWEGAYTGGSELDYDEKKIGSSEARVNADYAGVLLGHTLESYFGENYSQDIHFIGHSYGTVVNGLATRYLESKEALDDAGRVQFTVLDAPTNAPEGFAPNFDANWFQNNLSPEINYIDNYYGTNGPGNLLAYGEPIDGSGFDQPVDYSHSPVGQEFYPDLVLFGPNATTNPHLGGENHLFDDWITPILSTYGDRPGNDFTAAPDAQWNHAIEGTDFEDALDESVIVASLPGYSGYAFDGLELVEHSPVSVYQLINIPSNAEWLVFDWMVGAGGDGDWITMHFENNLLWSMTIDAQLENILLNTLVDITDFAGQTGRLFFTLNSVGESNAQFYVGNIALRGAAPNNSQVPSPPPLPLIATGLLLMVLVNKKRAF